MKKTLLITAAAALYASTAAAQAQQPAAATAPFPSRPGPAVAGICVVDNEGALAQSQVGRAYGQRIQQLGQQVTAELQPEQTAIETEMRAIQALAAGAPRQQRETALRTRAQNFQTRRDQRARELQATENRQLQVLSGHLRAAIDQVYGARNCGVLLQRGAVVAFNPALDITPQVVQGLNTRIQTITFNRETLPAQAAPAR